MKDEEKVDVKELCDIYQNLPDYLKGKLDGYAEAKKEFRRKNQEAQAPAQ